MRRCSEVSLIGSAFVVVVLLIAAWWSFWGAAGAAIRIQAGATAWLGVALGVIGPIGVLFAALSVSSRRTASARTHSVGALPPPVDAPVEPLLAADLPPLPD
jgi:hypothetical protein